MNWKHAVSLALLLSVSSGASAASAITYDKDGRYGYSMNQSSLTTAMQQSLHYCAARSRNCGQSASTSSEGYSAIATGTIALGFALGEKTADAAQRKAERMCRERANDCTLALLWRETPPGCTFECRIKKNACRSRICRRFFVSGGVRGTLCSPNQPSEVVRFFRPGHPQSVSKGVSNSSQIFHLQPLDLAAPMVRR